MLVMLLCFQASDSNCSDLCPKHNSDCFMNMMGSRTQFVFLVLLIIGALLAAYVLIMYMSGRWPG